MDWTDHYERLTARHIEEAVDRAAGEMQQKLKESYYEQMKAHPDRSWATTEPVGPISARKAAKIKAQREKVPPLSYEIAANKITATTIAANKITAAKIYAGSQVMSGAGAKPNNYMTTYYGEDYPSSSNLQRGDQWQKPSGVVRCWDWRAWVLSLGSQTTVAEQEPDTYVPDTCGMLWTTNFEEASGEMPINPTLYGESLYEN